MFNLTKTHEITVDTVIFTIQNDKLKVLLVKRANEPFKGKWTLPGGYVKLSETLDDAALRVLKEKTNIQNAVSLVLLYHFSNFGILSFYRYSRFCTESPAVILCTEFSFSIFFYSKSLFFTPSKTTIQ